GFMDPVDLYTVLGNALDNAIESVQAQTDPEKRMIDVLVCTEKAFLVMQVVNPLA
ncbi:MAG: GHKL domain-containing protein, partial [Oscillospiraceae bacterium]|nr:GHKL domain-containing protein [Oscillospiraceae bacterium]